VPEISRFLGVVISIYWEEGEAHHTPHFHVRYNEYRASYGINPIIQLAGALPLRQQRLVEAWAEIHQAELMENWQLVQQGRKPQKIQGIG
jgi:hypothetical protein